MTPREVADRLEIDRTLQDYFRCMDEKDYDGLARVFTPDAVLFYDTLGGGKSSYAEMLPRFRDFNQYFSLLQHMGGQLLIELDGDRATAQQNLRAVHVQETHEGEKNQWVIYGRYRDQLVRTAEGWRIADRYFVGTHSEGRLLPFDRVVRF